MKEFRDRSEPGEPGAVEDEVRRIRTIRGKEVLGYEGFAQAEHSGEPDDGAEISSEEEDLADNRGVDRPDTMPE